MLHQKLKYPEVAVEEFVAVGIIRRSGSQTNRAAFHAANVEKAIYFAAETGLKFFNGDDHQVMRIPFVTSSALATENDFCVAARELFGLLKLHSAKYDRQGAGVVIGIRGPDGLMNNIKTMLVLEEWPLAYIRMERIGAEAHKPAVYLFVGDRCRRIREWDNREVKKLPEELGFR